MHDAERARPLVTVLIPVHNGGEYLLPALHSVITQTYQPLDILLIDDGSTDGAVEHALARIDDPRIRVLRQANAGLAETLNRGLAVARGSLIARMDADDVAEPERIATQVAAMLDDPGLVLVGGQLRRLLGSAGRGSITRFPLRHEAIMAGLERGRHVLSHPAVMYRVEAVRDMGGYWAEGVAEDWDLFLRLGEVGRLANLPQVVLQYRFHESGINASALEAVRRNIRLATANHRARLRGAPIRNAEEFLRTASRSDRLAIACEVRSLRAYRHALRATAEGRRASTMLHLGLSGLFWPEQALRRVARR